MSNRNLTIFILLALVALTALLMWWNSGRFDWSESNSKNAYVSQSAEPYGLLAMHRLLENYDADSELTDIKKSTYQELPLDSSAHKNFVFIGEATGQDSLDIERLLAFVAAGNTAFLSSKLLPIEIASQLYSTECDEYDWEDYEYAYPESDTFNLRIFASESEFGWPFFFSYKNEARRYTTHYIPGDVFYCENENNYKSLGCVGSDYQINFATFRYGKGQFLLHSTPIAFTNFHLLREDGKAYCEAILNYLPEGAIYWDGYSQISESMGRMQNRMRGGERKLPPSNPIATMLQDRNLAWAWYLSLALGVLFVLFKGKRRQRTIPILPKNNNTSMEFIETIAQLHFKEKNYQGIAIQKMSLFTAYLRERYGVQLHKEPNSRHIFPNPETKERLSRLSEVPLDLIDDIFRQYAAIVDYAPTDEMLVDFHQSIEAFQLNAK